MLGGGGWEGVMLTMSGWYQLDCDHYSLVFPSQPPVWWITCINPHQMRRKNRWNNFCVSMFKFRQEMCQIVNFIQFTCSVFAIILTNDWNNSNFQWNICIEIPRQVEDNSNYDNMNKLWDCSHHYKLNYSHKQHLNIWKVLWVVRV